MIDLLRRCKMKKFPLILVILLISSLILNNVIHSQEKFDPKRFEEEIKQFEEMDKIHFPTLSGIVFTGSSSIKVWKTIPEDFAPFNAINRGFGGCFTSDVVYYADRVILPYKPSMVVLYIGDNDINSGKTPETVFDDFKTLVNYIHKSLPKTFIFYISIKPSVNRWALWEKMKNANELIEKFAKKNELVDFIDISPTLLGKDGKPRPELFADGLHLNADGYKLWTSLVRKHIINYLAK
jgi:lysophospholipase L1-like esterase